MNVINIVETTTSAAARTPAQQLRNLDAKWRESPFDPVLSPDVDQWAIRLRETMANLNSAFADTTTEPPPRDPPRGDGKPANGNAEVENPTGERPPVPSCHEQPEIQIHRFVRIVTFMNIWTTDRGNDETGTTLIVIDVVLPLDEERTPLTVDTATVPLHAEEGTMNEEGALMKIEIGRPAPRQWR